MNPTSLPYSCKACAPPKECSEAQADFFPFSCEAQEELEVSGGGSSFTKRFLKAPKRRGTFPRLQPCTCTKFSPQLPTLRQHKGGPQAISFKGQSLCRRASRNPTALDAEFLWGTLFVNHKAARKKKKKKKKENHKSFSFNPPKGNPEQEQHHGTTHTTDIYQTQRSSLHRFLPRYKEKS